MKKYIPPHESIINGDEKIVVVVSHGFGSSKGSPTVKTLEKVMPEAGIGVMAYDFPGHGESILDEPELRIENCLDALSAMEEMASEKAPGAEIVYFSSSFGAYITLLYLTKRKHAGKKAFLRSAAVNMPDKYEELTEEEERDLNEKGFAMVDHDYDRPLKITTGMRDDFRVNDLFSLYTPGETKIKMVHGTDDEVIDPEAARRFSEQFDIDITWIPGGDHRLSIPGAEDKVMELAKEFFLKK